MAAQIETNPLQSVAPFVAETLAPFERQQTVGAGNVLFREGDEPRGIYFVHDGRFDLLFASRNGEVKPLRSAGAGQILGLSCVVAERSHDCSATAKSPASVGFIPKEDFKKLLDKKPELWFTVLQMISSDISSCWDCMRSLTRC